MLFENLSFTDKLIEAHLNDSGDSDSAQSIAFVERDAESYR